MVSFSCLLIGFAFLVFMAGAAIGSFLGVVIERLPQTHSSICNPRSHCINCKSLIAYYDLIPIFSWCFLRGRCRYCHIAISVRLFLLELVMGGFALALWLQFGFQIVAFELFVFSAILIAIAFIDIDTWLIPISLPVLLIVTGLVFGAIHHQFFSRFLGCSIAFLFFAAFLIASTWVLRRLGRLKSDELAMGWGDPWLLAGIGAYIGIEELFYVVLLACIQGIVAFLIVRPKTVVTQDGWQSPAQAIVFGPFLALAGIEMALWGHEISKIGQQLAISLGNW